ncbi:hypothetical protein ABZP36_010919 [Zizania latifolia]
MSEGISPGEDGQRRHCRIGASGKTTSSSRRHHPGAEAVESTMDYFTKWVEAIPLKKSIIGMGIKLLNSSPYYAQANSQAEASNKSLVKLIKRKIAKLPKRWHATLADALWAYQMACHGSTQVPPYQLVYGHEAVLPWETNIGSRRLALQNKLTADDYYGLMIDELEDLTQNRLHALRKIEENKERVASHYNEKVSAKAFEQNDLV